jgi:UDP-N-acetylmuramate: L-alanyl-gamma-D-glutamyl-meso-diaminopimelate ligase
VLERGEAVGKVAWQLSGVHNQLNALAAIAAAQHVGVAPQASAAALCEFRNAKRRMELLGVVRGITVYDDFAHHPSAIRTTIDGLRRKVGAQRILAVFEPRSNTMKLGTMKSQLPWSLEQADLAFCHSAGLGWDPSEPLAPMGQRASVAASVDELLQQALRAARPGDHVLCMSNGGFGGFHARLLAALAESAQ